MEPDDLILIGRVARAHGNKGQVIVNLETDFPEERFRPGETLLVGPSAQPRRIVDVKFHQGRPIVGLHGIETMNDAEGLSGAELKMPAAALAPLPEGTYYHHDLIGCEVRDRQGTAIGRVSAIEGPIDRSRLVIDGPRGEVLIPLAAEICVSVDPAARQIVVDPPEGLLDLNTAGNRKP
jgi:16S rRNA processing protein RimM